MRETRYHISLYIIIPVITAGFTLLATIVSYNITLLLHAERGCPDRAGVLSGDCYW